MNLVLAGIISYYILHKKKCLNYLMNLVTGGISSYYIGEKCLNYLIVSLSPILLRISRDILKTSRDKKLPKIT